jgi:hypothetical protein
MVAVCRRFLPAPQLDCKTPRSNKTYVALLKTPEEKKSKFFFRFMSSLLSSFAIKQSNTTLNERLPAYFPAAYPRELSPR